jgi:hypothetical protein
MPPIGDLSPGPQKQRPGKCVRAIVYLTKQMDRLSHQRHVGFSPFSDREVKAGVAFLIEFLSDDYPKTMLDAEDLVRGLASAIRHAPSAIEGYRDHPDTGHQANLFDGLRKTFRRAHV